MDADANPNMTRTTDGKQHMLARKAEEEIHFHRVLLSSMVTRSPVTFSMIVNGRLQLLERGNIQQNQPHCQNRVLIAREGSLQIEV